MSGSKKIPTYPWSIPQESLNPQMKEFLHKPLVGGLGYVPGICWKILRQVVGLRVSFPINILPPSTHWGIFLGRMQSLTLGFGVPGDASNF